MRFQPMQDYKIKILNNIKNMFKTIPPHKKEKTLKNNFRPLKIIILDNKKLIH